MKITGKLYGNQAMKGYIIPRGNDGFSPVITVAAIAGGSRITIQDIEGEKFLDVLNGAVGPAGATGAKGDTGEKGETGERGPAGPQGETGKDGAAGAKGEKGDPGKDGEKGEKGDKGDAYTLTAADKAEIAALVLAEMPEGADVPTYDNTVEVI